MLRMENIIGLRPMKILYEPYYLYKYIDLQEYLLYNLIMSNPIKATVELTKDEKIKQLNEKLNIMLKLKKVNPAQLAEHTPPPKNEQKKEEPSIKPKQPLQKTTPNEEEQPNSHLPDKTKKIKKPEKKDNRNLRKAAGEVWQDKTMQDWPQNDYRIFCGNLGNEVNDQILSSVFRRYSSFNMARVVRDRRTGHSRGYGFLSFSNPNDFLNALKEMNGKYVGNRPVKLTKSSWKQRDLSSANNQHLPSDFKKNSQKVTHQICVDYKYVSPL